MCFPSQPWTPPVPTSTSEYNPSTKQGPVGLRVCPRASALPGNSLEMQTLRPHPRPNQKLQGQDPAIHGVPSDPGDSGDHSDWRISALAAWDLTQAASWCLPPAFPTLNLYPSILSYSKAQSCVSARPHALPLRHRHSPALWPQAVHLSIF